MKNYKILQGDCIEKLRTLRAGSCQMCVTSPPYWGLRDYGVEGQIGQEPTIAEYVAKMVEVFSEVKRVLRDDGTLWLNLGDSYANSGNRRSGEGETRNLSTDKFHGGRAHLEQRRTTGDCGNLKPKDLCGVPWRVAFALQADGWYLRQEIIWCKPGPMPESVTDRCTRSHEHIFLLTKQPNYFYDAFAIQEKAATAPHSPGNNKLDASRNDAASMQNTWAEDGSRNKRSVWTVASSGYAGAHFACFPPKLILPCILAGTSAKGCCAKCGAPYKRILEKERTATRPGENTKVKEHEKSQNTPGKLPFSEKSTQRRLPGEVVGNRDPERHVTTTKTTGWESTCDCGSDEVKPCVVIDPFLGSGTSIAVALSKNRRAIGIELNPEYIELAEQRIRKALLKKGFGI